MLLHPLTFGLLACLSLRLVLAQTSAAQRYAPTLQPCPQGISLVREVGSASQKQTLSQDEQHYMQGRTSLVLPSAWAAYYSNVLKGTSLPLPAYVEEALSLQQQHALPRLGIATSGGGLRAALFGAGVLSVLDGRNQTSSDRGTGGLLQGAKYLAGLSGGSWLVLSLSQTDFPMLPDLVFGTSQSGSGDSRFGGWITEIDLLQPGNNASATAAFLNTLFQEVSLKWAERFPVTVTDIWGRSLARHFVNGTTAGDFFDTDLPHGAGITLSSVAEVSSFRSYQQPFPIVLADSITGHPNASVIINETGVVIPLVNPIYEFNVYETGSFDPALGAFTPTRYLGSPNKSVCATGFDQLSFIEGTSSTLFNTLNTSSAALLASSVGPVIEGINKSFPQSGIRLDAAQVPNPFFGVSQGTYPDTISKLLTLVDGGEDGEKTPYQPLLVKARGLDTIIAIDAAADTADNWADGTSLIATQERVKLLRSAYSFPSVPATQAEFLALNLTKRPTFFGCDSSASTDDPLVIYIANGGPPLGQVPLTNTSTNQLSYTADEAQAVLNQAYDIATQGIPVRTNEGGLKKDPEWPACLACAVVDRSRRRLGLTRTGLCASCLKRYCWS
ncbi:lysophospholipase [Trametes punicea]|nr:lysophospholipase [Trametes punicea]